MRICSIAVINVLIFHASAHVHDEVVLVDSPAEVQGSVNPSFDTVASQLADRRHWGSFRSYADFDNTALSKRAKNDVTRPVATNTGHFSQRVREQLEYHSATFGKLPQIAEITNPFTESMGHFSQHLREQLQYPKHMEKEMPCAKARLQAITAVAAFARAERAAAARGSYSRGPRPPEANMAKQALSLWRQAWGLNAARAVACQAAAARKAAKAAAQTEVAGAAARTAKTWATAAIRMTLLTKYIEHLVDA
eukprot:gnl/TRDRNA2_/TRDRNA2_80109_c0_seq1.p1 gnl/TRDRNA2_/TRDRNA2_80109_c0~~gnl/TRDRNA2_/TRDRNA2_80109_c0_seq1.p1  ORF type:complete len:251 (-),score=32.58 gnl/TRDRNA2_/TRDRNA2_80109_c0_seq1:278-1030(-)